MRLIDADKIGERAKELLEHGCSLIEFATILVNEIREAPTVDAVPVVRCRECGWERVCKFSEIHGEDGFCSRGERKDGDG